MSHKGQILSPSDGPEPLRSLARMMAGVCDSFTVGQFFIRQPRDFSPSGVLVRGEAAGLKVASIRRFSKTSGGTMRKVIRTGVFTAATACVAVGVAMAQAPQASESSTPAKSITITGCVQAAEKAP